MIKCCIFDLDGTMLNTITTITYYVNQTLQKHSISAITEEECKSFVGKGARWLIMCTLRSKGIDDAELTEKLLRYYNSIYDRAPLYLTAPYDGILPLIDSLRSKGLRLAVLSNKPDTTVKSIVSHFFKDSFEIVLGARDGVPLKPDPKVPHEIANALDVNPSECVWIGDTGTDIETGKNFGVGLNIGVLWGFRAREELVSAGADITVSCADEILSAITEAK